MKNEIALTTKSMTTREIAKLTGKVHKNVSADCRKMFGELELDELTFQRIYLDSMNREQKEYLLPKRECLILTSGYSIKQRTIIIDRWMELEEKDSMNHLSSTELIIASAQRLLELEKEQAETKEIMKRVEARQEMMEKGFHDFTILAYVGYKGMPQLDLATANKLGRKAAKYCRNNGHPIGKVRDPRFGLVNSYPEEVLDQLFQAEINL